MARSSKYKPFGLSPYAIIGYAVLLILAMWIAAAVLLALFWSDIDAVSNIGISAAVLTVVVLFGMLAGVLVTYYESLPDEPTTSPAEQRMRKRGDRLVAQGTPVHTSRSRRSSDDSYDPYAGILASFAGDGGDYDGGSSGDGGGGGD